MLLVSVERDSASVHNVDHFCKYRRPESIHTRVRHGVCPRKRSHLAEEVIEGRLIKIAVGILVGHEVYGSKILPHAIRGIVEDKQSAKHAVGKYL